jgi:signal transduction histidine kinase
MRNLLYEAIDDDLNRFAEVIENSYNPLLGHFEELIWKFDSYKRYRELYIIVYNSASQPIFASPMTQYFQLDIPLAKEGLPTGHTLHTLDLENIPFISPGSKTKISFRAISRRMTYQGYTIGWIQAALPITNTESQLDNLLKVMIIFNLAAVLLMALGGYFLIRKLLNPLQTINEKARKISYSNMNERIKIENENDELGQLSHTLNELLSRLQMAFISQKQFVADAAHELKTPLAILKSHMESEINNKDVPNSLKEKLNNDLETISRMTHIINNLLMLAKTEAIQEEKNFAPVNLQEVIENVFEDINILAQEQRLRLTKDIQENLTINGDPIQLYRLFFNLLENAVKYCPAGSKVKISLEKIDHKARVIIEDNGPGIANRYLPYIFDRFYRINKARSRKKGGSGLGLSIVKMITDLHNGTIEVKSQENEGAIFILFFNLL